MPPKEPEPSAWAKLTTPGAEFDRDELSDVLHWIRQVLALVLGLAYGCIPITGASGNLSFFMVSVVPVHMYLVNYLDIDDKEHGGYIAVAIEGLPAAFATFTLCWMLSYSLLHAAELPV